MKALRISEKRWLLYIAIGWLLLIGPGRVEGNVLPAASPMELISIIPSNGYDFNTGEAAHDKNGRFSAIWVGISRLRHPNCKPRKLEWFLGPREGNNVPVTWAWGPPVIRDDGYFTAGPWIIGVSVDKFTDTHSDVLHQCHTFGLAHPWLTRSPLWN